GQLLWLQLGGGLGNLHTQVRRDLFQIERQQNIANGFGADLGSEAVGTVFVLCIQELLFIEQLVLGEGRQTGIENNVGLEIQDALNVLERHVKQQRDARRQRLQEPDVRDRRSKFNMPHALATNAAQGDFNTALFADDALELHALVLAAQALIVLHGAKDARAEQAI